jgi:hypothetical protein
MSPGTKAIPASSRWWSFAILVAAVALFWGASLKNKPSRKAVDFDVVCETFLSPAFLSLNLKQDPTELVSLTAYDFYGSLSDASTIRFAKDNQKQTPLHSSALHLQAEEDMHNALSYLEVARQGLIGNSIPLNIDAGVALSSAGRPEEAPTLTLVSKKRNDVELKMSSGQINVKAGNRYTIPEVQPKQIEAFSAELQGKDLVSLRLLSGDRPNTKATLRFTMSKRDLPLLTSPVSVQNVSLSFDRAVNPYIRLDNKPAQGITSDRKTDIVIECESVTVNTIAIVGDPEKRGAPTLRVTGTGRAKSVRQDGDELMPTRLHEILDEPLAERTRWLILLGGLAAVLLKAVDHALDILLDWAFPKE